MYRGRKRKSQYKMRITESERGIIESFTFLVEAEIIKLVELGPVYQKRDNTFIVYQVSRNLV